MNLRIQLPVTLCCAALLGGLAFAAQESEVAAGDKPTPSPLAELPRHEARANTYTDSDQEDPSLAIDADGRVLVTWSSRRQELGTYGVFAQLLDSVGRPLGTELHVNETLQGSQQDAYAVFGPEGSAWVAWSSIRPDTEKNGVFLRRLADGKDGFAPVGSEVRIGQSSFHYYSDPALAVTDSGALLAVWVKTIAHQQILELQRISADGELVGEPLVLDTPVVRDEAGEAWGRVSVPDVVALPDGAFFVVWARADSRGYPLGIFGRRVDAQGELAGELVLSDRPDSQHVEPSIDVDEQGNLTVAWMSVDPGGGDYRVLARRFDLAGAPRGASFEVDPNPSVHKSGATAIAAHDGRFAIAYNLHGAKVPRENDKPLKLVDIRVVFYDEAGKLLAAEQLETREAGPHRMQVGSSGRHAAWTDAGQFAVAWSGASEGDKSGVGVSLATPEHLAGPAPTAVEPVAALSELSPADMEDEVIPILVPPHLRNLKLVPATYGSQAATGFQAHDQTQFTPPDPAIGVGPDRIITQANGELAIFDKIGVELLRVQTNGAGGFWGSLGGGNFIVDPVNVYDWHSDRFLVMNTELLSSKWFFPFAVSTNSSPTTSSDWFKYRPEVTPVCNFADFPNIGYNDTAYFITTDCFSGGGNRAYIFDKTIVNNGGVLGQPPSLQMSPSLQSLGNTSKLDTGSTQYFVSAGFSGSSPNLKLQAIIDPTGSPSVATFQLNTGKSWGSPPDAPQMGSGSRLDTIDNRVKHGVVRNGKLYCTHNVGVGGVTRVRWYEINLNGWPSGGSPSVADTGDIDLGAGIYTWFGDVYPEANGNLTIAYNRSAANEFASIEYVTRLVTDPPGTTSAPTQLQISTTPDNSGRFGDYGYIAEDPANVGTFYSTHEYSQGPWATWVGTWEIPGGGFVSYCTAKTGLLCGVPSIAYTGVPEACVSSGFEISAGPARGNRNGLVLYSCAGRAAIPFQGGLLCVAPAPLRRSSLVNSMGTNGACDGVFRLDLNAFASGNAGGNPDPCLCVIGQQVNAQWWGRDSVTTGSFLSDALEYFVAP